MQMQRNALLVGLLVVGLGASGALAARAERPLQAGQKQKRSLATVLRELQSVVQRHGTLRWTQDDPAIRGRGTVTWTSRWTLTPAAADAIEITSRETEIVRLNGEEPVSQEYQGGFTYNLSTLDASGLRVLTDSGAAHSERRKYHTPGAKIYVISDSRKLDDRLLELASEAASTKALALLKEAVALAKAADPQ